MASISTPSGPTKTSSRHDIDKGIGHPTKSSRDFPRILINAVSRRSDIVVNLSRTEKMLADLRYGEDATIPAIAETTGKTANEILRLIRSINSKLQQMFK